MINPNTTISLPKKSPVIPSSAARPRTIMEETLVAAKVLCGGYFNTWIYKSALDTSS